MWPNLDTYGVKISIAQNGAETLGLLIQKNGESQVEPNYAALVSAGFDTGEWESRGRMLLQGRRTFTLSQLKEWFPGFDSSMVDREAPVPYVNIKPKAKITDVGEKIGGARKDLYAKGISVKDLANMNDMERRKYVKKALIWPYSYKEAKERGVSCAVALWIKTLRNNILEFDDFESDLIDHEAFVRAIEALKRHFDPVKTSSDLIKAIVDLNDDPDWIFYREALPFVTKVKARKHHQLNKFRIMLSFGQEEIERAQKNGYPPYTYLVGYDSRLDQDENESLREYVWNKTLGLGEKTKRQKQGDKKIPERPHLDCLVNDWLPQEDVTAEQFMERFGFRGVEFGEWLPQDERQRVLNEAYGACVALASVLNIPDKAISFNGYLAAAFGSRGRGGKKAPAAHYEPHFRVFNLTRMNGAGSMAHEWAHALDNYISSFLLDKDLEFGSEFTDSAIMAPTRFRQIMEAIYYSKDPIRILSWLLIDFSSNTNKIAAWLKFVDKNLEPNELALAVQRGILRAVGLDVGREVLSSIVSGKFDFKLEDIKLSAIEKSFTHIDLYKEIRNMSGEEDEKRLKELYHFIESSFKAAELLRKYVEEPENIFRQRVATNYFCHAKKLDLERSKKYWSLERELFARAFECFVYDALLKTNRRCDYLVHSVSEHLFAGEEYVGNPYPFGQERVMINHRMQEMASQLRFLLGPEGRLAKAFFTSIRPENSQKLEDSYQQMENALDEGADPDYLVQSGLMSKVSTRILSTNKDSLAKVFRLLSKHGLDMEQSQFSQFKLARR